MICSKRSWRREGSRFLGGVLFVLVWVLLAGCSLTVKPVAPKQDVQISLENPFRVDVDSVANRDSRLYVSGQVRVETSWNLKKVVLGVVGTDESGTIVSSEYRRLWDVWALASKVEGGVSKKANGPEDPNPPGTVIPFVVSIPATGISAYRVELAWGKEAQGYSGVLASPTLVILDKLQIGRTEEKCGEETCSYHPLVEADLLNLGDGPIETVVLGIRMLEGSNPAGEPDGETSENEEQVELAVNKVMPGERRAIRVVIDSDSFSRSATEATDGASMANFRPVIRVVSAK